MSSILSLFYYFVMGLFTLFGLMSLPAASSWNVRRMRSKKGFSLDQLLITIVLIGILGGGVGLAVSSAKDAAEQKLIDDTTQKITSMLQTVGNTEAVKISGTEADGAAALTGSGYYIDINDNSSYDAGTDILYQASLPSKVASVSGTIGSISVTLN